MYIVLHDERELYLEGHWHVEPCWGSKYTMGYQLSKLV